MAYTDNKGITFNTFDTKFFKTGKISNAEYDQLFTTKNYQMRI